MRGKLLTCHSKVLRALLWHNGCVPIFVHDFSHYIFFQLLGVSLGSGVPLVELGDP